MQKGFVLTGVTVIILLVVIVAGNYVFVSQEAYQAGISRVMLIDTIGNVHNDVKGLIALNDNNILDDTCTDALAVEGRDRSWLEGEIVARVSAALQTINNELSASGVEVLIDAISVNGAVSGGQNPLASADIDLYFTVTTTDDSIVKKGHIDADGSS